MYAPRGGISEVLRRRHRYFRGFAHLGLFPPDLIPVER